MRNPLPTLALTLLLPCCATPPDPAHFDLSPPDAASNPLSQLMLRGDWLPANPHDLDFDALPRIPSQHVVVSDARADRSLSPTEAALQKPDKDHGGVHQHNYLAHHDGKLWIMWSDGPGVEDRVGQRVQYATSRDGLHWSEPRHLTPEPPGSGPDSPHFGTRSSGGLRYISRGFWKRDGELLALASLDEAAGFFGPSLELHAFRWTPSDRWEDLGVIADDAINNFPPQRIPNGEWMMSRRTFDYKERGVQFLVGGLTSIDSWDSFPVLGSGSELTAEEPFWWTLPDGNLMALFRDNRKSGFIYRSFSTDGGRSWSRPVATNFPDATSKFHGVRLRDGRYVLVSNPRPGKRDPMTIAVSRDGAVFHSIGYLVGERWIDYPYVFEYGDSLLIAFSGAKQTVEVLKVKLEDLPE